MNDQTPHKIKVFMTLEGSYELMSSELKELLNDYKELAESRGFKVVSEDDFPHDSAIN